MPDTFTPAEHEEFEQLYKHFDANYILTSLLQKIGQLKREYKGYDDALDVLDNVKEWAFKIHPETTSQLSLNPFTGEVISHA